MLSVLTLSNDSYPPVELTMLELTTLEWTMLVQ